MPIDSTPPGATVTYLGKTIGVTPCVLVTGRRQKPVVEIDLPGYHRQVAEVGNRPMPTGYVLMSGLLLLPILVDIATNSDGCLNDDLVDVYLTPSTERPPIVWRREDRPPTAKR